MREGLSISEFVNLRGEIKTKNAMNLHFLLHPGILRFAPEKKYAEDVGHQSFLQGLPVKISNQIFMKCVLNNGANKRHSSYLASR